MPLRNTETEWGSVTKFFHWSLAIIIIGSSAFVLHINDSTPWFKSTAQIFVMNINWHKLLGILALILILARLLWRRKGPVPHAASLTPLERKASAWMHRLLYILMVLVPITGWLSSSAFGSPVRVFGLFNLPLIWPEDRTLLPFFYWSHFGLSWALLTLVVLHIGAALYHHFVRKDDVLRSMLPRLRRRRADPS
jgi:cytochrome b561